MTAARRASRTSKSNASGFLGLVLAGTLGFAAGCGDPEPSSNGDASAAAPRTSAALRVRVENARAGGIAETSEVTGQIDADRIATVSAERGARVTGRLVEPGARVEKGAALIQLDPELARVAIDEARASVTAREVDLAESERALARGDELKKEGALSDERHDGLQFNRRRAESAHATAVAALQRARRALSDSTIRAPFAGTVESVHVTEGDFVAPGTPVAMLGDFTRVRVRAGVTAAQADPLAVGQEVLVSIPALGGPPREAQIESIGRIANPGSGTYPMELWLDNEDGRLRQGMTGIVRLTSAPSSNAVTVPRAALVRTSGQLTVFVVETTDEGPRADARSVVVGRQGRDRVEIVSGLDAGDAVVVDGLFALSDGARISFDPPMAAAQDDAS